MYVHSTCRTSEESDKEFIRAISSIPNNIDGLMNKKYGMTESIIRYKAVVRLPSSEALIPTALLLQERCVFVEKMEKEE